MTISQLDNSSIKSTLSMNKSNTSECISENDSVLITGIIFILSLIVAIATAGGNFLVILAVILVKKLQTPSNILIGSLAFSDFFVALLVLPFTIIDAYQGYWPFNEGLCDMYISFDVLLCTASILNLCAISIDRYLVITKPLTYASRRTPQRMAAMIATAWIGSALISIPPNFGWKDPFQKCACEYSKNVGYQVYATFFAFYLPLIVMIILYGRIFKLAREMSRSGQSKMTAGISHDEHIVTKAINNGVKKDEDTNDICKAREYDKRLNSYSSRKLLTDSMNVTSELSREAHGRRSRGNSDTKVIKTLGVIMGCFCLCWLPFFMIQLLLALLSAAGYNTVNMIPVSVFRFLQWLGYVNSFLNPLIYAKFDREFRGPFKMILLCHCRNINARLRAVHYSAQYGLPSSSSKRQSIVISSPYTRNDTASRWLGKSLNQRCTSAVPIRPRRRPQMNFRNAISGQTDER
ncbi:putative biogenic amine (5HT) receptor [Schistosoma mansoni]|uniref:5HT-1 receptor n=1 Tax=Schistosoma mansoni TaxID=6183 RepID=G4V5G4_SCHMA|nr:putative biogenic amine (5HT) receptor [Schistosoma mansoni]AGZ89668.1 5HT-1 receptor [Schistosoma mansoni]|eukprot:XP_018648482.1 putative biogenic amine (5HT) receptor [Schistosoma mansoni]